jgi:3-hydroxyisobutyrate dehydrogenase-like beta-hydroxyacid dehydrogenase
VRDGGGAVRHVDDMTTAPVSIAVLGLGPMGYALARALAQRGHHRVTVWNRTPGKTAGLDGVAVAPDPRAAVAAAPLVIACVSDYAATLGALEAADLAGKVVVQLATGTPGDARAAAAWAAARGADYLDAAILAVPEQIGRPESTILVSGSETAFRAAGAALAELAGTVSYVGPAVGAAAALDFAVLSYLFGGLLGLYHGARICEVEGLRVADYGALLAAAMPALAGMVAHDTDRIQAEHYTAPQSALAICARTGDVLIRHAREVGIDDAVPRYLATEFGRGVAAGFGDESPAAMVKVLRAASSAAARGAAR